MGIKYLFNETGYQFTILAEFYFDKAFDLINEEYEQQ